MRHEQLGTSTHAQIMRRVISRDLITELDGEAEFENWGCEGTREMSGDTKSKKLTSLGRCLGGGFLASPYYHVPFL